MKIEITTTEDGSHTLYVPELDEHYHSTRGAIQESEYVYIERGLGIIEKENISVVEIGFGTGLNALLTAQYASKYKKQITYTSFEKYPIPNDIAIQLNYTDRLTEEASDIFKKLHNSSWGEKQTISEKFTLLKLKSDIITLPIIPKCDLIYFDAFAPSKQKNIWHASILEHCYNALVTNGVFVTYCAKGDIRRILKSFGMKVERLPGPPGKWEMLRATKL